MLVAGLAATLCALTATQSVAASSPRAPVAAPDKRTDAGRFTTRWAKDVTAENAWAEYPRPALLRSMGLCAAVYTQIYDTGGECNGWLTYDRAVSKIPPETLRRLHGRLYRPLPELKMVLPPLAMKGGACRWRSGAAWTRHENHRISPGK
jgi:hypothetical protein